MTVQTNGLISSGSYTETVLAIQNGARIVVCRQNGEIVLYRIETLPGVLPYAHKWTYWQGAAERILTEDFPVKDTVGV